MADAGPSNAGGGELEINREVHPSGIVPQLQNVVATVNLGCKLDLKEIALHARNAEYNPKRFAAVVMRIREPKTTALIFASGKMVCTGAKSEDDSRVAARKYAKIVQKLGFQATFKEFKIQNIVGSCDVKFPIRLEGLSFSMSMFCNYEPEIFPGLIYRMKVPKVVLLIFVSGKVVLTGAKHREEIYEAFENIYPVLQDFRKGDAHAPPALMPPPGTVVAPGTGGAMTRGAAAPALRVAAAASAAAANLDAHIPPPSPMRHNLPPPSPAHPGLPPPTPLHDGGLPPPSPYVDNDTRRGKSMF
ncbi:hypothetical protein FOA52_005369 [Chlamydomonas sp. UWO 241]|nr:hypothetical protein FOA52_005369 [Chlamydomonas sp. UWO 241]